MKELIKKDISLAPHTSWRVGGKAQYFTAPTSTAELQQALHEVPINTPKHWVGLGSNLLIRDGGVLGLVIASNPGLCDLKQEVDDRFFAMAGVPVPKLARKSVAAGFGGLEFLSGIPGTVGGALAMNAGCDGSTIWQMVSEVMLLEHQAPHQVVIKKPSEFTIGYRSVSYPQEPLWFLGAWFSLPAQPAIVGSAKIKDHLARRNKTQPIGSANCGSVFKNPDNDYAGRLIEVCGGKGITQGGAIISEKHANFIINRGGACALEIEQLATTVKDLVQAKTGITLQREFKVMGSAACQ